MKYLRVTKEWRNFERIRHFKPNSNITLTTNSKMNFSFHSSLFSLLLVFLKLTQCADQSIMSYQTINPDPKELASLPDETRLIYNLMRNYDPASRPVYNASKPVQIKFGMSFIQLCDMVKAEFKILFSTLIIKSHTPLLWYFFKK